MGAVDDYAAIGKIYREQLGGNPFGIEPEKQLKPIARCMAHPECDAAYDPNTGKGTGTCKGYCDGGD